MSLSKQFATDKSLEVKGVGVQFPANEDGSIPEFVLTRMSRSNPEYQRIADRVWKPFRQALRLNALPKDKHEELDLTIFAEATLIGWKNVPMADVTGIASDTGHAPYNKDNVIALMKRLPDLYESLLSLAVERSTFQAAEVEADAKNSLKSSATSSSKDH